MMSWCLRSGAEEEGQQKLETEEVPSKASTFEWQEEANIRLEITGSFAARYKSPVDIW